MTAQNSITISENLARAVSRRYMVALVLIGTLTCGVFLTLHLAISAQDSYSQLINLSGRQRMLSQRAAMLALELKQDLPEARLAEVHEDLRITAERMKREHEALTLRGGRSGLNRPLTQAERDYYFSKPHALDAAVKVFLSAIEQELSNPEFFSSAELEAVVASAETDLLAELDGMVSLYESEAHEGIEWLLNLHRFLLVLTLLTLVAEARWIFLPLVRKVREDTLAVSKYQADLEYMSLHDGLTGLANRILLREKLDLATDEGFQTPQPCAVLQIDLDHFKHVNDTLGHSAGDMLLKQAARRIESVLDAGDMAARLGGDEFAVLLVNTPSRFNAAQMGERIIGALSQPFDIHGTEVYCGASIGVTVYPEDAQTGEDLMKNADMALYESKRLGRACVSVFSDDLRQRLEMRHVVEHELRRALDLNELYVHYQPVLCLETGKCVSAEAVVRWKHPVYGSIAPSRFVAVAEDTGLGRQLAEFVIKTALTTFAEWRDAHTAPQSISVNLSGSILRDTHFIRFLPEITEQAGLIPAQVTLEITESTLIERGSELAVQTLQTLRGMGFCVALDDFGTGYASLTQLKNLPISQVKIDGAFVGRLVPGTDDEAIVRSVVELAQLLGLEVLGEGVETQEQARLLKELGCMLAQGYFYAHPMSDTDFAGWYAQHAARELVSVLRQVDGSDNPPADQVKPDMAPAGQPHANHA